MLLQMIKRTKTVWVEICLSSLWTWAYSDAHLDDSFSLTTTDSQNKEMYELVKAAAIKVLHGGYNPNVCWG